MIIFILKLSSNWKLWYIINLFLPMVMKFEYKTEVYKTKSVSWFSESGEGRQCVHVRILWHFLQWDPNEKTGDRSRKGQMGKPLRHLGDREAGSSTLPWEACVHAMSNDCSPWHC